jgi:hypothetical protein
MVKKLINNLYNLLGWRTNRKIIVFKSDDWGSIRMPSIKAYENLKKANIDIVTGAGARYNKYDTLASSQDLDALFEVLGSVKDRNGNSGKFTALSLCANPDFEKIKRNNFQAYYYEPFTKTLDRYNIPNAFEKWKEGIEHNIKLRILNITRELIQYVFLPLSLLLIWLNRKTLLNDKVSLLLLNAALATWTISNLMLNISQGERFLVIHTFLIFGLCIYLYQTVKLPLLVSRYFLVITPFLLLYGIGSLYASNKLISISFFVSNFLIEAISFN